MRPAPLLLLTTVTTTTVHASDALWDFLPELPSTSEISIGGGLDSVGGWSRNTALTLEAPAATLIFLSTGESNIESDRSSLRTRYWNAAFSTDPAQAVSVGIAYDKQDSDDAIDIDGISITLAFNTERFSFSLTPGRRDLSFSLNHRLRAKREAPIIDSRDILASASWFATTDWTISATYRSANYSKDMKRLAADPRLQLALSPETLQLSTGLEKRRLTIGVQHYFPQLDTGLEWSRSLSAVDNSAADSTTLLASKALSRSWRIDASTGISRTDYNADTIFFGNISVAYLW